MTYHCCRADSYKNAPTDVVWRRMELAYSLESAATLFMEQVDDLYGQFGIAQTADVYRYVLVWDDEDEIMEIIEVEPKPKPGYDIMVVNSSTLEIEMGITLDDVVPPEFQQIES